MLLKPSRTIACAAILGVASTGAVVVPATAEPPPAVVRALQWKDCLPEPGDTEEDKELIRGSQCATLQVPVDWNDPAGPTFALAVARRTAKKARVGSLIFGPGGPGDSGVDRIRTGMSRFSADLQNRFDIVSFDPRGIARSNPVKCSAALLAQRPSPIIGSQVEFDQTIAYNRKLAEDCRANTGPVYDHIDTLQTVQDLNAIRIALGESQLTFHGSSYGTLLGAQYAERYPKNVRAMVLESVFDHGTATTRQFLDAEAGTAQDSFDEFVKWCASATTCALHGRDVHALWADLLTRAGRGEVPDPQRPQYPTTPFFLSYAVFRLLYAPQWVRLGDVLQQLDASTPPTGQPPVPSGLQANTFAPFCRDFSLPVRDYREFAGYLKRLARNTPDFKYPGQLLAVTSCLGLRPVPNPQRNLAVRHLTTPILLSNAIHDPATGYNWATDVARQLGRNGVLLTYQGWGHGSYNKSPCVQATIDKYLVSLQVPPRGTSCPAVQPTG